MEITIGNYKIHSDGRCVTLSEIKTTETGNKVGSEYDKEIGYFPNLSQACDRLLEEKISMSSATDIQELRTDIERYRIEILEAVKNLNQT